MADKLLRIPSSKSGEYADVLMYDIGNGTYSFTNGDTAAVDAFQRSRVSSPFTLSEHSFEYDLLPLWFHQLVTKSGGIAHNSGYRSATLTASTTGPAALSGTVTVAGASNPRTATFTGSQTLATGDVFVANGVPCYVITGATGTSFSVNSMYTVPAGSSATLRGSWAELRQKSVNLYEKGKSHLIKITGLFGAAVSNVSREAFYGTDYNGLILRQSGTGTISLVMRSYVTGAIVESEVTQSQWNKDKLDGTGTSGMTLNTAYGFILVIDLQFLGVGRVRVGFDIDGKIVWCHEFLHANRTATVPYWQTANLPVGWRIYNTGTSAGATMRAICSEVESEGGSDRPNSKPFAQFNTADISVSTSLTHLISIRPGQLYNSIPNRIFNAVKGLSASIGTQPVVLVLLYNCTLSGGAWNAADASSGMEFNIGAVTISTPGVIMSADFIASSASNRGSREFSIKSQYPLCLDIFGANPTSYTVAAIANSSTSACRASVEWEESF